MPQEYPRVPVPPSPKTATIAKVAPNSVLRLDPNRRVWKAQDSVVGQARRIVAEYGLMGSSSWAVPAGTVDPDSGAQDYPHRDEWRTVAVSCARQVPGTKLEAHVLYCPAGLTQFNVGANWFSGGAWARLRVRCTWTNGANTSGPHDFELTMEGSNKGQWGGAENTEAGSDWNDLRERVLENIMPPDFESDPEIGVQFSEWSEVDIELQVLGGERIVHAIVYEVPSVHTQAHDHDGALTVHGATSNADKPRRPQTDAKDGATFEDDTRGTHRLLWVHERQAARLGPRILNFAANSHSGSDWNTTEQTPITVSGSATTLRNLFDTTLNGYNTAHPGWIVAGSMAQLYRLHGGELFMRNRAAVIPVRVCVDCERTTSSSTLRLQSSSCEWIDVTIPADRTHVEVYGYLSSQVYGDHFAGLLLPLVTVPNDGTVASIYNITIEFWEDEEAMSFETLYDVDYAALANNTFADGNETIDDEVWVAGGAAAANTFAVENGTGIHFNAATTSTAFTSSVVDCSRLRIQLDTLIPSWDPDAEYLFELYYSTLTLGVNNNRVVLSLYKDATTDALVATGRHRVSGTQRIFTQTGTTITNGVATVTSDTFAFVASKAGIRCLHGTYDAANAEFPALDDYEDGGWVPMPHVADWSLMAKTGYFILAFPTGEAGGAMDVVLRRMRVRKIT